MVKEEIVDQEEIHDTRGKVETRICSSDSLGHMVGDVACLCEVVCIPVVPSSKLLHTAGGLVVKICGYR